MRRARPGTGPPSAWFVARSGSIMARRFAALLVTTAFVAPAPAQPAKSAVPGFVPATVLEGRPRDRGRAYGTQFRDAIRGFLDREIDAAFVGKPSTKEQMLQYAAACGKVVRAECPLIADEFEGIADGAG